MKILLERSHRYFLPLVRTTASPRLIFAEWSRKNLWYAFLCVTIHCSSPWCANSAWPVQGAGLQSAPQRALVERFVECTGTSWVSWPAALYRYTFRNFANTSKWEHTLSRVHSILILNPSDNSDQLVLIYPLMDSINPCIVKADETEWSMILMCHPGSN